jgi:hypothetical protein
VLLVRWVVGSGAAGRLNPIPEQLGFEEKE